jgi:hypothetical protein
MLPAIRRFFRSPAAWLGAPAAAAYPFCNHRFAITGPEEDARLEPTSTGRACPKCCSTDYLFRGRKKVTEPGKAEVVETKYRCKGCGHEWKVRVGANGEANS